jgi:XTP/dITP diphosphohydrolase
MTIVLATKNRKKVEEMKRIFSGYDVRFLTLDAFPGVPDIKEDGSTFRANAVKKAVAVALETGCPAIADDSGLVVEALGGAPGVYSARYAGEDADDRKNVDKLLRQLKNVDDEKRGAKFVCSIAFALPDGKYKTFSGQARGRIGRRRIGANGFGYDPVFYPAGRSRTFAQMSDAEKDSLSHRGKAMKKFYGYLRNFL